MRVISECARVMVLMLLNCGAGQQETDARYFQTQYRQRSLNRGADDSRER
jgi:hypothetical protein